MASLAQLPTSRVRDSTQFIITVDRLEKQRWKAAADDAGLSMAEYVRRAVGQAAEAPTAAEIAHARDLAVMIDASVERMEAMLDRTIARIDRVVSTETERARRAEILADIDRQGLYLDLDALAALPE